MPKFVCDVILDERQFERELQKALAVQVQQLLTRLKPQIADGAKKFIADAIANSPEWHSLLEAGSGERISLQEHFGLRDPQPVLTGILRAVQDGVVVDPLPASGDILGGFIVRILPNDYAAELKVGGTSYMSEGKNGSYLIPWLKWLLVGGAGMLVVESQINVDKPRAGSRTGRAIMVTPTRKPSAGWRVPTEYSGTTENNWLTRSLFDGRVGENILSLFQKLVTL